MPSPQFNSINARLNQQKGLQTRRRNKLKREKRKRESPELSNLIQLNTDLRTQLKQVNKLRRAMKNIDIPKLKTVIDLILTDDLDELKTSDLMLVTDMASLLLTTKGDTLYHVNDWHHNFATNATQQEAIDAATADAELDELLKGLFDYDEEPELDNETQKQIEDILNS